MAEDKKINPLTGEALDKDMENPLIEGAPQEPAIEGIDTEGRERGEEIPEVAETSKSKNFLILGVIVLALIFMLVTLLTKKSAPPPKALSEIENVASNGPADIAVPAIPTDIPAVAPAPAPQVDTALPPPPPIPETTEEAPPLPAPPPPIAAPETPAPAVNDEKMQQRIRAPMLTVAGDPQKAKEEEEAKKKEQDTKKKRPATEISEARVLGDTSNMVIQGKVIDAVLETAVNTDLPGVMRAIVSRDVYAESGSNVLIPKGSRLVGAYNAEIKRGQARVYIIWNRVIRPDGVDIALDSPGIDLLGRTGLPGRVDSKYFEIFGNALLFSTISYAFAAGAEAITGSQGIQETENPSGSRTVSGKASDQALSQNIQSFGSVVKGVAGDLINVRPTITLDQGTPVKVFVNKDLIFDFSEKDPENSGIFK